jgi:Bax protein
MTWAPVQLHAGSDLRRLGGVLALDGLLLLVVLLAANPPHRPATVARVALAPGPGPLRAATLFAGLAPQSPPLEPTDLPGEGPVIALALRMPEPEAALKPDPMPLIVSAGDPPEPPALRPEQTSLDDPARLAAAVLDPALPVSSVERVIADAVPLPVDVDPIPSMAPSESFAVKPALPERLPEQLALVAGTLVVAEAAPEIQAPAAPQPVSAKHEDLLADRVAQPNMAYQDELADALVLVSLADSWERPDPAERFVAPPPVITRQIRPPADPLAADPQKDQFVNTLIPLINEANSRILADRGRLLQLEDAQFLARLREEYHAPQGGMEELLRRVDVVPPSLAIAQAAQESGWGALREPQAAPRSLFGQMVERRLAHFSDATAAVAAYIGNLNSHNAYGEFRAERARLRAAGRQIEGETLVSYIQRYSERGMDYVNSVKDLIDWNKLGTYDRAHWDDRVAATARD